MNHALVQRLLFRALLFAVGDDLRGRMHLLHHLVLVLQRRELARHDPEHDRLVWREPAKGLEGTGPLGVVLQLRYVGRSAVESEGEQRTHIVGVGGDVLEEGDGDPVVAALAEVTSALSTSYLLATTVALRARARDAP